MKVFITTFFFKVASILPLNCCRFLGRTLGRSILPLDKRTNKAIETNLAVSFPNLSTKERNELRKKRLQHMGMTLLEIAHIMFSNKDKVLSYCNNLDSNQDFVKAAKSELGLIILIPHIGNWEAVNFYLSQICERTIMYRALRDQNIDKIFCNVRKSLGTNLVPINNNGVKGLLSTLKRGGAIVLLPDQVPVVSGGVYAPLFDEPALTMTLAERLAKKTGAKVFIGAGIQNNNGFNVSFEEIDQNFYSETSENAARILNQHIEKLIAAYPEQNQWEYKRYKFCPDYMEKDIYGHINTSYRPEGR